MASGAKLICLPIMIQSVIIVLSPLSASVLSISGIVRMHSTAVHLLTQRLEGLR